MTALQIIGRSPSSPRSLTIDSVMFAYGNLL
jgi:hypothetical protein